MHTRMCDIHMRVSASQALRYREAEMRALRTRQMLDAACVASWALTAPLCAAATFGLAAATATPLPTPVVLVCLSLFGSLIAPLNALPWVLAGAVDAHVSAGRLAAVLAAARPSLSATPSSESPVATAAASASPFDVSDNCGVVSTTSTNAMVTSGLEGPLPAGAAADISGAPGAASADSSSHTDGRCDVPCAVQLEGASFAWLVATGVPAREVLRDITLTIPKV
jgi:ABC-type multidrug transport system fused ATPase/permease subunit